MTNKKMKEIILKATLDYQHVLEDAVPGMLAKVPKEFAEISEDIQVEFICVAITEKYGKFLADSMTEPLMANAMGVKIDENL